MTADTLRRLQSLRGLTRTGSTHTVLAAVQGDLQTVIEAVLDLAGREHAWPREQNTPATAPESADAQPEYAPGSRERDAAQIAATMEATTMPPDACPGCKLLSPLVHELARVVAGIDPRTPIPSRQEPATPPARPEPVTDEPAVGAQVTDSEGDVWQRFEDGWRQWLAPVCRWSFARDGMQSQFGPLRATTDDDRRRVGLPVRDENTPPALQNGPQEARSADSGTGRIGWLRLHPDYHFRYLAREVEGGWSDTDRDARRWIDTGWPNAVFTPLLPGFFVAPDGENVPTIWRETDGEPVWVMARTPYFAAFFDAVAGLLETREEA